MITNRPKEGTWENSMKNSWVFLIWGPSTLGHTFWSDADIYMYVYGESSTIHVYLYIYLHLYLYLYIHIHDILKILQKLQITIHKISQGMVTTGTNCYPEVLHLPSQDLKSHLASLVLFVSSSIILGVVITKGNHDYVFIECPKHRVKREALISPSLTNSTSFSEITLFTILFLPDLFLWINVHMSDQKIHCFLYTHGITLNIFYNLTSFSLNNMFWGCISYHSSSLSYHFLWYKRTILYLPRLLLMEIYFQFFTIKKIYLYSNDHLCSCCFLLTVFYQTSSPTSFNFSSVSIAHDNLTISKRIKLLRSCFLLDSLYVVSTFVCRWWHMWNHMKNTKPQTSGK